LCFCYNTPDYAYPPARHLVAFTALALLFLRFARPKFKYPWILASGGATLAFFSVFLWQIHFPQSFSLPSWQLVTSFQYVTRLAC